MGRAASLRSPPVGRRNPSYATAGVSSYTIPFIRFLLLVLSNYLMITLKQNYVYIHDFGGFFDSCLPIEHEPIAVFIFFMWRKIV